MPRRDDLTDYEKMGQWLDAQSDWERGRNKHLPGYDQWWLERAERNSPTSRGGNLDEDAELSSQEIIHYLASDNERKWDLAVSALRYRNQAIVDMQHAIPHLVSILDKLADKKAVDMSYSLVGDVIYLLDQNKQLLSAEVMLPILLKIFHKRGGVNHMIKYFAGEEYLKNLLREEHKFSNQPCLMKLIIVGLFMSGFIIYIITINRWWFISRSPLFAIIWIFVLLLFLVMQVLIFLRMIGIEFGEPK